MTRNIARASGAMTALAAIFLAGTTMASPAPTPLTDTLTFGDTASEASHALVADHSEIITGAHGATARRFMPLDGKDWRGGTATFRLTVDAERVNYVSIRLWGEDESANQLTLYCDGKQIGYRHVSDVDVLDQGTHAKVAPGRFYSFTFPLPQTLTAGKTTLGCKIRATGPIWRYGGDFAKFQKPMTEASRGVYALYVHTEPFLPDFADNGHAPVAVVSPDDKSAVFAKVRTRIDTQIEAIWNNETRAPNQMELNFLARAYEVSWSKGYHSPESLKRIVAGLDALYETFKVNPKIAEADPVTPNPEWFGLGLAGQALKITAPHLQADLDGLIPGPDGRPVSRREAYAQMFIAAREHSKHSRRLYTNQCMIKDLYGIWYDNEGLIAVGSSQADARETLLPFLYEAVGLMPWTGSRDKNGKPTYSSAEADANFNVPANYYLATQSGLTKELGFVGGYGEILDWATPIYNATRPSPDAPGDAKIKAQLIKLALARAPFRYPHFDPEGHKAMRLETVAGWRDIYFPGDIVYGQRSGWDASPFESAVATGDPRLIGYAQQMLEDNQFFENIVHNLETPNLRATIGLLDTIDDYETIRAQPKAPFKLPMSDGAPDFVFADPEDGVVAVKNGQDVLYASLYWRANYGINHLGRVHLITPTTDRSATVRIREEFTPSGQVYTRPNNPHINGWRFSVKYPDDGDTQQAQAGETLPIAKLPAGSVFEDGQDNPYAGRADYYEMRYGPYLIAINASKDKTFDLVLPPRAGNVTDLVSREVIAAKTAKVTVKPGVTYVVYLGLPAQQ